jgi:hypothetical protein
MRWMIVGAMVAAGSLAGTAVRAQESDARTGATGTGQVAQPKMPPYGAYVPGDNVTPDADGVPVANPNPMSEFMDQTQDEPPVDMPLVDDPRANDSGK